MNGKDQIDKAIEQAEAPGDHVFPTWNGRIELPDAEDGTKRAAVLSVPQDITIDGILMVITTAIQLHGMAETKRAAEKNSGLVLPEPIRIIRPA